MHDLIQLFNLPLILCSIPLVVFALCIIASLCFATSPDPHSTSTNPPHATTAETRPSALPPLPPIDQKLQQQPIHAETMPTTLPQVPPAEHKLQQKSIDTDSLDTELGIVGSMKMQVPEPVKKKRYVSFAQEWGSLT